MYFQRLGGSRLRCLAFALGGCIVCTSTRGPATGRAEKISAVSRNVVLLPVVDSTQVHFLNFATLHSIQLP